MNTGKNPWNNSGNPRNKPDWNIRRSSRKYLGMDFYRMAGRDYEINPGKSSRRNPSCNIRKESLNIIIDKSL